MSQIWEPEASAGTSKSDLIDWSQEMHDAIDEHTDALILEYQHLIADADAIPASSTKAKYLGRAVHLGEAINALCRAAGLDEPILLTRG